MTYKLGLDTGGTYTDAVIVDGHSTVVAQAKSLTTHHDLSQGVRAAIESVLQESLSCDVNGSAVSLVSLSTTLATNALVEGKGRPIALILIGYTDKQFLRADIPAALGGDAVGFIAGGHTASGEEQTELDVVSLTKFVEEHQANVDAFAVSSMFAVRNPEHEIRARELVLGICAKPVSCGFELSSALDAPRRALTAILNARLIPLIKNLLDATSFILDTLAINAPLMVVKGDGSLVSTEFAKNSPVETILSGPAASVVGAQFMSGASDLVVSDMGGTTTDIAMLRNGRPKLDPSGATVGGWRTMVNAVLINTHGLGGDSSVVFNRESLDFDIGPQRVIPVSLAIQQHPELLSSLETQLEQPYVSTHAAQFAVANSRESDPAGLSAQQVELWQRILRRPIALTQLFEDQTLDRPLSRLMNRGLVLLAGFTPSDACHVIGTQADWDPRAAGIAAELLMRYSEYNLGPQFKTTRQFAEYLQEKVSRQAALRILEATMADQADLPNLSLNPAESRFIQKTFMPKNSDSVSIQVRLGVPVMGIGAPAASYYSRVAELLDTELELPQHGAVANALGAVVGSVRQSANLTILPSSGKQVRVHSESGPREFPDLEQAVSWCIDELTQKGWN